MPETAEKSPRRISGVSTTAVPARSIADLTALIAGHEERFVADHGTRDHRAELVPPQHIFGQRLRPEVAARIEVIVTQEIETVPWNRFVPGT